jgi:dipeptidyl aminopeptidase/acylaminoacyl peptidase
VVSRANNLFLKDTGSGEEKQITKDGLPDMRFGIRPSWYKLSRIDRPESGTERSMPADIAWSDDSRRFITYRYDNSRSKDLLLFQTIPDSGFRARVYAYERALPGDTALALLDYFLYDTEKDTLRRVCLKTRPAFLAWGMPRWIPGTDRLTFLVWHRGYRQVDLVEINGCTGETQVLLSERSSTYVDLHMLDFRILRESMEILWLSERDGWNHLYLMEYESGRLKHRITEGAYVVREIVYVDEKQRTVLFTAGGREMDRDPYYRHLYRVSLDGGEPVLLTPEDAEHEISGSPKGRFVVDTYSRVDQPSRTVLRSGDDGRLIRVLEEADIQKLKQAGWRPPERFRVKARDGKTDLYGVLFRPSGFDPEKSYPVIDATYSGPQAVRTPKSFLRGVRNQDLSLAELGFIVITVDGMGTANRSKSFHDVSYRNLGDCGTEDHIAALRQLARRYPYMDLNRVGIYGHSAGGYDAVHAMLTHPGIYKVGVSSAGNHDHRMAKVWWPELYMGYPVGPQYAEQSNLSLAGNLMGRLLLVHGDMDNNVNPACTLRMAGALIEADRDFDLLILPNSNHDLSRHRYFIRKRWDYFVRFLMGEVPPSNYVIQPWEDL